MTTGRATVRKYGVKMPHWQIGKTAATISFVEEAENILFHEKDPKKFVKLKEEIDRLKSGEKELHEWVTDPEAYIDNL